MLGAAQAEEVLGGRVVVVSPLTYMWIAEQRAVFWDLGLVVCA